MYVSAGTGNIWLYCISDKENTDSLGTLIKGKNWQSSHKVGDFSIPKFSNLAHPSSGRLALQVGALLPSKFAKWRANGIAKR